MVELWNFMKFMKLKIKKVAAFYSMEKVAQIIYKLKIMLFVDLTITMGFQLILHQKIVSSTCFTLWKC